MLIQWSSGSREAAPSVQTGCIYSHGVSRSAHSFSSVTVLGNGGQTRNASSLLVSGKGDQLHFESALVRHPPLWYPMIPTTPAPLSFFGRAAPGSSAWRLKLPSYCSSAEPQWFWLCFGGSGLQLTSQGSRNVKLKQERCFKRP